MENTRSASLMASETEYSHRFKNLRNKAEQVIHEISSGIKQALSLSLVAAALFALSASQVGSESIQEVERPAIVSPLLPDGATHFAVDFSTDLNPLVNTAQKMPWRERGIYVNGFVQAMTQQRQSTMRELGLGAVSACVPTTCFVDADNAPNALMMATSLKNVYIRPQGKAIPAKLENASSLRPNESNVGQSIPPYNITLLGAPKVWPFTRGEKISVSIFDSGLDPSHPALKNIYKGLRSDGTYDTTFFYDPTNSCVTQTGNAICDVVGHGTAMAGAIAGSGQYQIGMAPEVKVSPFKVCDESACTEASLSAGVLASIAPGGDPNKRDQIISNSWGVDPLNPFSFHDMILLWRASGMIPFFSAGNDSGCNKVVGPALDPNVITISSLRPGVINDTYYRSTFASQASLINSDKPDLYTPGEGIIVAWLNNGYQTVSGTSPANALAAGGGALLLSARPDLIGNFDAVKAILMKSSRSFAPDNCLGGLPSNRADFASAIIHNQYLPIILR